mgnify:CR=1 FL=1
MGASPIGPPGDEGGGPLPGAGSGAGSEGGGDGEGDGLGVGPGEPEGAGEGWTPGTGRTGAGVTDSSSTPPLRMCRRSQSIST